jgi:hypothetical protein
MWKDTRYKVFRKETVLTGIRHDFPLNNIQGMTLIFILSTIQKAVWITY